MNNPWRQPVNAHLRKAGALAELARRDAAGLSRLATEALLEASLLQLVFAIRAYLNELAENYQCAAAGSISSPAELQQALQAMDKQPAELNEILIADSEGWLKELYATHSRIGQHNPGGAAPVRQARPGLIETRQVKAGELDCDSLEQWLTRVKELVERHREMMVEC